MRRIALAGALAIALGGCASNSADTYSSSEVGRVIETASGTVISSREVNISGSRSGMGAAAGGATGAVVGATSFSGGGGAVAGVLMGIAGAVIGGLAEEMLTSRSGVEYTIETNDGRVVSVVQNAGDDEAPLPAGTPVRVQWGTDYARVTPDVTAAPAGRPAPPPAAETGGGAPAETGGGIPAEPADDWVNPDEVPLSGGGTTAEDLNRRQLRGGSGAYSTSGSASYPEAAPAEARPRY